MKVLFTLMAAIILLMTSGCLVPGEVDVYEPGHWHHEHWEHHDWR